MCHLLKNILFGCVGLAEVIRLITGLFVCLRGGLITNSTFNLKLHDTENAAHMGSRVGDAKRQSCERSPGIVNFVVVVVVIVVATVVDVVDVVDIATECC